MAIDPKLIDKLLAEHGHQPETSQERRAAEAADQGLLERAMQAALPDHLGYAKHGPAGYEREHATARSKGTQEPNGTERDGRNRRAEQPSPL